jgi:hypothetical protein
MKQPTSLFDPVVAVHILTAVMAALVGVQTSHAESGGAKNVRAQQKVAIAESTAAPFTPAFWQEDRSPAEYLRNDPARVYTWVEAQIKSVPGKPDQFSTREERQQYEAVVAEKMKAVGPLALVVNCKAVYDADRQTFQIRASAFPIKDLSLKEPNPEKMWLRRLMMGRTNIKRDVYTGQNAYGATAEINREVSDDYVIAYPSGEYSEPSSIVTAGNPSASALPYLYNYVQYSTSVSMPPGEARDKHKDISCLAVVSLEPPYIFRFQERTAPTRDLPFDMTSNGFALYGKLDRLWFVNKATGDVYSKHSRSGL